MSGVKLTELSPVERSRTYVYPDGQPVVLTNVTHFGVSQSGNHRLKADGVLHIVAPGWRHIKIDADSFTV